MESTPNNAEQINCENQVDENTESSNITLFTNDAKPENDTKLTETAQNDTTNVIISNVLDEESTLLYKTNELCRESNKELTSKDGLSKISDQESTIGMIQTTSNVELVSTDNLLITEKNDDNLLNSQNSCILKQHTPETSDRFQFEVDTFKKDSRNVADNSECNYIESVNDSVKIVTTEIHEVAKLISTDKQFSDLTDKESDSTHEKINDFNQLITDQLSTEKNEDLTINEETKTVKKNMSEEINSVLEDDSNNFSKDTSDQLKVIIPDNCDPKDIVIISKDNLSENETDQSKVIISDNYDLKENDIVSENNLLKDKSDQLKDILDNSDPKDNDLISQDNLLKDKNDQLKDIIPDNSDSKDNDIISEKNLLKDENYQSKEIISDNCNPKSNDIISEDKTDQSKEISQNSSEPKESDIISGDNLSKDESNQSKEVIPDSSDPKEDNLLIDKNDHSKEVIPDNSDLKLNDIVSQDNLSKDKSDQPEEIILNNSNLKDNVIPEDQLCVGISGIKQSSVNKTEDFEKENVPILMDIEKTLPKTDNKSEKDVNLVRNTVDSQNKEEKVLEKSEVLPSIDNQSETIASTNTKTEEIVDVKKNKVEGQNKEKNEQKSEIQKCDQLENNKKCETVTNGEHSVATCDENDSKNETIIETVVDDKKQTKNVSEITSNEKNMNAEMEIEIIDDEEEKEINAKNETQSSNKEHDLIENKIASDQTNEHQSVEKKSVSPIDTSKNKKSSDNKETEKTMEIDLIDDDLEIITVTDKAPEKTNDISTNAKNSDEDLEIISVTKEKNNVIDLEDSEAEKRRKRRKRRKMKENNCINTKCTSGGIDLKPATGFCLGFFKVKSKSNKVNLVCKECRDFCLNNMSTMINMLINGEPIVDFHMSTNSDCVEVIDSDEEDQKENEQLNETEVATLNLEIDMVLSDTLNKCNLDSQLKKTEEFIKNKNIKLNEQSFSELDKMLNKLQLEVDTLRSKLYEDKPRNKEQIPIEITDVYDSPFFITTPPKEAERRSTRRVSKPITYDESVLLEESPPETPAHQQTMQPNLPSLQSISNEQEIIAVGTGEPPKIDLPPQGAIIRELPKLNEIYHAMKSNMFGAWFKCRVVEIYPIGTKIEDKYCDVPHYKIRFEGAKYKNLIKIVTGKQLAYSTPCNVRLAIGSRVIALFKDGDNNNRKDLFTGVVAEPMTSINDFRYLIFFDDGYAQYVIHQNVYLLVEANPNVWEDVPVDSQEYIKSYLKEYPERPMVRLTKGQVVRTEWNGKWWTARVLQVDGSLVLMYFDADARSEWIYRGSKRLAPLFNNSQQSKNRQSRGLNLPSRSTLRPQLKGPYVEYTRYNSETDASNYTQQISRAVARKSTTLPLTKTTAQIVPFLPTSVAQPSSKVIYYTPRAGTQPALYKPHQCSPNCMKLAKRKLSELKQYSLLAKPILAGWFRACVRYAKNKREIRYITPCSRMIRNMQELHLYLRITQCEMSVDMFDFDFWVHILAEFSVEKYYVSNKDLSEGVENIPIQCLNYVDGTMPDYCRYTTKREPLTGVDLNLDSEFLCGCDCTDDCKDKSKCACWQLTIKGTVFGKNRAPDMSVGYVYKRLPEPVVTGIYECNSRCKCASTCLNRVVQHPLQQKLQIFKTANRGWGIRCLNDIPQGSFICIYAGHLLTEQMANEGGKSNGDEYLAELDYIEVVERLKEGYESDVREDVGTKTDEDNTTEEDDEDGDEEKLNKVIDSSDKDFICPIPTETTDSPIKTRSKRKRNTDDSQTSDSDKSESTKSSEHSNKNSESIDGKDTNKEKNETKDKEEDNKTNSGEEECVTISDDEDTVRERVGFIPTINIDDKDSEEKPKNKSVRAMFGEDETCYVMDAKNAGNIGRFLNHSCNPNVFVQNVFVDTHDLRFPWVAFFALVYVRAGTELTWNYNYDVGSVPGKVLYCHCGQPECRGRLL